MKRFTVITSVVVALMLIFISTLTISCNSTNTSNTTDQNSNESTTSIGEMNSMNSAERLNDKEISASLNEFSFDIFKSIEKEVREQDTENKQNVFISPFSIFTALSMTNNGASDGLREGMSKVLKISDYDIESVNASMKYITETLQDDSRNVKLSVANSIWQKEGFKIFEKFKNTLSKYYNAIIESVNFADASTKDKINSWISDNTNGLIKKMISRTSPNDVLYLVNAIYFYGQWLREFDKENTRNGEFTPINGKPVKVDMMNSKREYMYGRGKNFDIARLSYGKLDENLTEGQEEEELFKTDKYISMYILLPRDKSTVYEILNDLDNQQLEETINKMSPVELDLSMPKFEINFGGNYKEILDNLMGLGMPKSNSFNNMTEDSGNLSISKVLHQAVVKVNEEGTEAAAATVVAVKRSVSMSVPFKADKPFMFVIRDDKTKAILFSGILKDPTTK